MSADEKACVLERVEASPGSRRKVMEELGVPKSTYYRWRARQRQGALADRSSGVRSWNRLTPEEETVVLDVAMEYTDLSSRQLSAWITDNRGFSVSESTVYRILKGEGLIKSPELKQAASKEFHTKTKRPHQMWATDASYFRVAGWGFYYMVTVMDDFSRFILSWKLQTDMTSDSFIEVLQDAIDLTGMTEVPLEDRTRLLSDNGPGYVSRSFREYLHLVGIRHILAAPFHPQTNGKIERYHQSIKADVNQVPYDVPRNLEAAISDFVSYYNYRRYHKALGNVTPADVLHGRREQILQQRKEVQTQTLARRKLYNQQIRELARPTQSIM
jgi:transposase InsO family protein